MLALILGILGFVLYFVYDINSYTRRSKLLSFAFKLISFIFKPVAKIILGIKKQA